MQIATDITEISYNNTHVFAVKTC